MYSERTKVRFNVRCNIRYTLVVTLVRLEYHDIYCANKIQLSKLLIQEVNKLVLLLCANNLYPCATSSNDNLLFHCAQARCISSYSILPHLHKERALCQRQLKNSYRTTVEM